MKKTLIVNLNGRVFTIDEDAYRLLENYLSNLRIHFRKEEGATEIIADFEARIEELFNEKIRLGHQVITFEHVEEVIARVGRPADFADQEDKEEKQMPVVEQVKGKKKFYRNMDDKLLGGVCSGIAAYFDWSVVAIRFLLIISPVVLSSLKIFFIKHFIPMFIWGNLWFWLFIAYLIAWIVVPAARTAEQKLQMRGKPITVENIGKTVSAQSTPVVSNEPKGCLAGVVDLFVAFLKVCLAGLGCLIGLPLLFALFIVIIVLFAVMLGVGGGLLGVGGGLLGSLPAFLIIKHPVLLTVTGLFVIGIPLFAILYAIIAQIAKWKPLNQSVKWSILLVWIVSLILLFTSGFRIDRRHLFDNNWKWPFSVENRVIRGNNIPSQKIFDLETPFNSLEIDKYLNTSISIEQTADDRVSIEITGDENLVEEVRYNQYDRRLILSTNNRLDSKNNLKITLRTNDLNHIQASFVGSIRMDRAFTGDNLEIIMKGVGNFRSDSLYVKSLTIRCEGVGSVGISGKADKVHLETAGTGSVDAMELLSDTVYAQVNGVGSIQCNPVEYLEGRVNGVGSITYKEEPESKDVRSSGIGRIKRR